MHANQFVEQLENLPHLDQRLAGDSLLDLRWEIQEPFDQIAIDDPRVGV